MPSRKDAMIEIAQKARLAFVSRERANWCAHARTSLIHKASRASSTSTNPNFLFKYSSSRANFNFILESSVGRCREQRTLVALTNAGECD